jgi:hypothetical protein
MSFSILKYIHPALPRFIAQMCHNMYVDLSSRAPLISYVGLKCCQLHLHVSYSAAEITFLWSIWQMKCGKKHSIHLILCLHSVQNFLAYSLFFQATCGTTFYYETSATSSVLNLSVLFNFHDYDPKLSLYPPSSWWVLIWASNGVLQPRCFLAVLLLTLKLLILCHRFFTLGLKYLTGLMQMWKVCSVSSDIASYEVPTCTPVKSEVENTLKPYMHCHGPATWKGEAGREVSKEWISFHSMEADMKAYVCYFTKKLESHFSPLASMPAIVSGYV